MSSESFPLEPEPASVAAEVIVVADGAPVDPSDAVRESGARLVTIAGRLGPAAARSRGAALAQGELLAFVDADIVVDEDALTRLVAAFEEESDLAAAFGGDVRKRDRVETGVRNHSLVTLQKKDFRYLVSMMAG